VPDVSYGCETGPPIFTDEQSEGITEWGDGDIMMKHGRNDRRVENFAY
jgi:hypothetical protein